MERYQDLSNRYDELKCIHKDLQNECGNLETNYKWNALGTSIYSEICLTFFFFFVNSILLGVRERANIVLDTAKKGQIEQKHREQELNHLIGKQRDHIK